MLQLPCKLHCAVGVPRCSLRITLHPRNDCTERMSTHGWIVSHVLEGVMSMAALIV
jgi:hypothetical protein